MLELFFSAVRSRGGFSDNPTSRQFKAAFKRLLLRCEIKVNNGNCIHLDATSMLTVAGEGQANEDTFSKYELENFEPINDDHDYDALPVVEEVSEYKVWPKDYSISF